MELTLTLAEPANPFARVALLHGSDARREKLTAERGWISHKGTTDLYRLSGPHPLKEFHVTRDYFRKSTRFALEDYDCLFNMVADPDVNPETLKLMARILRGYRGRVINPPDAVLGTGRDGMARRLDGIDGVIVPPVLRFRFMGETGLRDGIARRGLAFPAIARGIGVHNGRVLGLFDSPAALLPHLEPREHYYLTSFVPYASRRDGLFRKYRFFFLGGHMLLRHLVVSDGWNVHVRDRDRLMFDRPDLLAEERRAIAAGVDGLPPPVRARLEAIRERAGLDVFGLDCALLDDDRILVFEANAAMSFFGKKNDPRVDYLGPAFARGAAAFRALVASR